MKEQVKAEVYADIAELITTTVNTKRLWSNWGNDVIKVIANCLRNNGENEKRIKEDLRYINSVIIDVGYEFARVPLATRNWVKCGENAHKVLDNSQLAK